MLVDLSRRFDSSRIVLQASCNDNFSFFCFVGLVFRGLMIAKPPRLIHTCPNVSAVCDLSHQNRHSIISHLRLQPFRQSPGCLDKQELPVAVINLDPKIVELLRQLPKEPNNNPFILYRISIFRSSSQQGNTYTCPTVSLFSTVHVVGGDQRHRPLSAFPSRTLASARYSPSAILSAARKHTSELLAVVTGSPNHCYGSLWS